MEHDVPDGLFNTGQRDGEINEALTDNMVALKIPNWKLSRFLKQRSLNGLRKVLLNGIRMHFLKPCGVATAKKSQGEVSTLLRRTISYHDYGEDFYHAFLSGIFAGAGYQVDQTRNMEKVEVMSLSAIRSMAGWLFLKRNAR